MKRNGFLLLIAIGLTTFVYFFQERKDVESKLKRVENNKLFQVHKLGRMLSFSTAKINVKS